MFRRRVGVRTRRLVKKCVRPQICSSLLSSASPLCPTPPHPLLSLASRLTKPCSLVSHRDQRCVRRPCVCSLRSPPRRRSARPCLRLVCGSLLVPSSSRDGTEQTRRRRAAAMIRPLRIEWDNRVRRQTQQQPEAAKNQGQIRHRSRVMQPSTLLPPHPTVDALTPALAMQQSAR